MRLLLLLLLPVIGWASPASPANVFVHPLIAWPDKAFVKGSHDESRMDEWFVTAWEFEKLLESLETRGYILVRASDAYGPDGALLPLEVPGGRKPLLLSVDDLNYYPYMRRNGTVSRLAVVDGRLVAQARPGNGRAGEGDEVMQVLDRFVAAHPGFSYKGARGLLAVTGYNGLFGWPVQWAGPELEESRKQARAVADWLKAHGWEFASHSYAHRMAKGQSFESWKASEQRWDNEIAPLLGKTPYYVFPYGEHWWGDAERWQLLRAKGYRVFFGVETSSTVDWKDGLPIVGRVPIDGRGLRLSPGMLSPFLDAVAVLDPQRPATMKY